MVEWARVDADLRDADLHFVQKTAAIHSQSSRLYEFSRTFSRDRLTEQYLHTTHNLFPHGNTTTLGRVRTDNCCNPKASHVLSAGFTRDRESFSLPSVNPRPFQTETLNPFKSPRFHIGSQLFEHTAISLP